MNLTVANINLDVNKSSLQLILDNKLCEIKIHPKFIRLFTTSDFIGLKFSEIVEVIMGVILIINPSYEYTHVTIETKPLGYTGRILLGFNL